MQNVEKIVLALDAYEKIEIELNLPLEQRIGCEEIKIILFSNSAEYVLAQDCSKELISVCCSNCLT